MYSYPVKSVPKIMIMANLAAARLFEDDAGNGSYLLEARKITLIQEDSPQAEGPIQILSILCILNSLFFLARGYF